jgi:uncharacterized protein GlcG (DUF336 family)
MPRIAWDLIWGALVTEVLERNTNHGFAAFAKSTADRVEGGVACQGAISVFVIDTHGNVVLKHRMSGAAAFSIELCERKAYTSALVRMRTADLLPLMQPGQALSR